MKCAIIILLQFFLFSATQAQEVTRQLIVKDKGDSTLVHANDRHFEKNGNYSFVHKTDTGHYVYTSKKNIGPLNFFSQNIELDSIFSIPSEGSFWVGHKKNQPDNIWYTGAFNLSIYGPVKGKIISVLASYENDCIAVEIRRGDTIFKIVNGITVGRRIEKETDNYEEKKWCTFSNNGHALYYIEKGGEYILYLDRIKIARSRNLFSKLFVNDRGDYMYLETTGQIDTGKKPLTYLHLKDTTIGPIIASFSSLNLQSGGGYYAFDKKNKLLIINDILYNGIVSVDRIIMPDRKNYLFSCITANDTCINVNGRWYHHHVYDVEKMAIDEKGNFAYYMLKDYYLYKVINGVVEKKSLSKYGVRARPLYISPLGSSIHYFATDDSAYLYRDDQLLHPPMQQRGDENMVYYHNWKFTYDGQINDNSIEKFALIKADSTNLHLFNGVLLRFPHKDEITTIEFNDNGFFTVRKLSERVSSININNLKEIEIEADELFFDSYCLEDKELILFGREGLSFYKYTIKL